MLAVRLEGGIRDLLTVLDLEAKPGAVGICDGLAHDALIRDNGQPAGDRVTSQTKSVYETYALIFRALSLQSTPPKACKHGRLQRSRVCDVEAVAHLGVGRCRVVVQSHSLGHSSLI